MPVPATIEAAPGVTAMLVRLGAETVRTAVAAMPLEAALIVVVPAVNALAIPELEIEATAGLALDHVTVDVRLAVDVSE